MFLVIFSWTLRDIKSLKISWRRLVPKCIAKFSELSSDIHRDRRAFVYFPSPFQSFPTVGFHQYSSPSLCILRSPSHRFVSLSYPPLAFVLPSLLRVAASRHLPLRACTFSASLLFPESDCSDSAEDRRPNQSYAKRVRLDFVQRTTGPGRRQRKGKREEATNSFRIHN